MRSAFNQWLGRPSTICFLRRVLTSDDTSRQLFRRQHLARYFASGSWVRGPDVAVEPDAEETESGHAQGISRFPSMGESIRPMVRTRTRTTATSDATRNSVDIVLDASAASLETKTIRAKPFAESRWEADVEAVDGDDQHGVKRMIDETTLTNNMELWVEILHFRRRIDGVLGVHQVWRGMRKRGIDLPTSGKNADILWPTFLRAGLSTLKAASEGRSDMLREVVEYAMNLKEKTGRFYEDIYRCIMKHFFRKDQWKYATVSEWHRWLDQAGLRSDEGIPDLINDALTALSYNHKALQVWEKLYLMAEQRSIYDACMRHVIHAGTEAEALRVHRILIRAGELPGAEMSRNAVVRKLLVSSSADAPGQRKAFASTEVLDGFCLSQNLIDAAPDVAGRADLVGAKRPEDDPDAREARGIRPKTLSDHFCARLFATAAFSPEFVAKGLSALGVAQLGPLSLQVVASRSESPSSFSKTMLDIEMAGISIGDDLYSQVVLKVSNEASLDKWEALLALAPELFEREQKIEDLFQTQIECRQWHEAQIALQAISILGRRVGSSARSFNLLLRHLLSQDDLDSSLGAFHTMQSQNIPIEGETVGRILKLLATRKVGHNTAPGKPDWLKFTMNVLMYAADTRTITDVRIWKEMLKRNGMAHRWVDTRRLVLWITYKLRYDTLPVRLHAERLDHKDIALHIFTEQMQQALFIWAFQDAGIRQLLKPDLTIEERNSATLSGDQCQAWARGLLLLAELRKSGVQIRTSAIRKAFVTRMWILFGPISTARPMNNVIRRNNRLPLSHYVAHANRIWPEFVDWVDPVVYAKDHEEERELSGQFFGASSRIGLRRKDYVSLDP